MLTKYEEVLGWIMILKVLTYMQDICNESRFHIKKCAENSLDEWDLATLHSAEFRSKTFY